MLPLESDDEAFVEGDTLSEGDALTLLAAFVVWWNCREIAVLCPICGEVEVHKPL
jgi:hypothetical protein